MINLTKDLILLRKLPFRFTNNSSFLALLCQFIHDRLILIDLLAHDLHFALNIILDYYQLNKSPSTNKKNNL
jgi:hypothetical protein